MLLIPRSNTLSPNTIYNAIITLFKTLNFPIEMGNGKQLTTPTND